MHNGFNNKLVNLMSPSSPISAVDFRVVEDTPQKVSSRSAHKKEASIFRSNNRKSMKAKKLEFDNPAKKLEFDDPMKAKILEYDDPTGLLHIFLPRFFR